MKFKIIFKVLSGLVLALFIMQCSGSKKVVDISKEEKEAEHEKSASSASDEDSSSDEEDIVRLQDDFHR